MAFALRRATWRAPILPLGTLLALAGAALAWGQASQPATTSASPPASRPVDPLSLLRAEIQPARSLFGPTDPVVVRFLLVNPTDETIEVPGIQQPADGSVALPLDAVFGGSASSSVVSAAFANERPVVLGSSTRPAAGGSVLRLGAHSALGVDVDLRPLRKELRYSGVHRIDWRPLGGRVREANVELRVEPRMSAQLFTDYGSITFTLMYDKAPRNVENFLDLVRIRFYDKLSIHRVVPDFILQGGSPTGDGAGRRPDGKTVPAEFHDARFEAGTLAMALRGDDPNSASCQFFVALARLAELDGKYTIIGQARDEASLRTLRALAELNTDANHRPTRPLTIRSFTLVPDESPTLRSEHSIQP
jgi:cyclophilin family peptidyl-prolyl cis-trans isomerase